MHTIDDPSLPSIVTVGCVNFESVPRDKAATLEKILATTRDAARQGCDLVVFPELALNTWGICEDCAREHRPCGWHLEQAELAHGPSADAVAELARELEVHVILRGRALVGPWADLVRDWAPGAIEHFERAVEIDPGLAEAWAWIANVRMSLGAFESASYPATVFIVLLGGCWIERHRRSGFSFVLHLKLEVKRRA